MRRGVEDRLASEGGIVGALVVVGVAYAPRPARRAVRVHARRNVVPPEIDALSADRHEVPGSGYGVSVRGDELSCD